MDNNRLLICGGGIIGVTLAREAALKNKFTKITIIEKDNKFGSHSSTRNSGVVHAGFYYSPESLKAKFCSKGNQLMRKYCIEKKIKTNRCGKVVVTKNQIQEETILELYNRGIYNGCELYLLGKEKLAEYEPLALTHEKFLWSPNTWSVSPIELFNSLINECKEMGINFIKGQNIISAKKDYVETSSKNKYYFDHFINACGGYALEVAKLFKIKTPYKLLPFKGLYLKSVSQCKEFSKHIYPVPDIEQPFLGIHTTITSDNFLKLGPTAIPVFSPENYTLFEGLDLKLSREIFFLQLNLLAKNEFNFRDLAFREMKYLIKKNIILKANELTSLNLNDIKFEWNSPGIRAQLFNQESKQLENDFVLITKDNSYHILNSISPAWSCSFVNAKKIINDLIKNL